MAIFYNAHDHIHYGTNAERLADTLILAQPSAQFFETDTNNLFQSTGTAWIAKGNTFELDGSSLPVQRVVDAAPFAYDENLDQQITNVNCSSADNGGVIHRLLAAGTTNATSVKATPGRIHFLRIANTTGTVRYFKLYNLAAAPTVGTSTPVMTFMLPINTVMNIIDNDIGIYCSTGIAYAITTGLADSDTGAVTANDVIVNMIYR